MNVTSMSESLTNSSLALSTPTVCMPALADSPADRQSRGELAECLARIHRTLTMLTNFDDSLTAIHAHDDDDTNALMQAEACLFLLGQLQSTHAELNERLRAAEARVHEQSMKIKWHANEARTDALTNLSNRRAFEDELSRRTTEVRRSMAPLTFIMIDVDHFKRLNDTYGHRAGDGVLRGVATALQQSIPGAELIARYGGEEFAVVLTGMSMAETAAAADCFRRTLRRARFKIGNQTVEATASCGVALLQPNEHPTHLVQRSDAALYSAKQAGRNATHCHTGSTIVAAPPSVDRDPDDTPLQFDLSSCDSEEWLNDVDEEPSLYNLMQLAHKPPGLPGACRVTWCDRPMLFSYIRQRIAEWNRGGDPFCLLLTEIDNFDHLALRYGCRSAELVLRSLTLHLDATMREMDVLCQLGRSSTVILLPRATVESATMVAERIRAGAAQFAFPSATGCCEFSVSIGRTDVRSGDLPISLLDRLKNSLNAAQRNGGDQVGPVV